MTQEEIKNYLKKNLKIEWVHMGRDYDLYLAIKLDGEIISKVPFGQD